MSRQTWSKKSAPRRASAPKRSQNVLHLESLEARQMLAADLVSLLPADNATNVDVNSNLVLTFASDVQPGPGAGRILIMNAADDSLIEAVAVNDAARVNFAGASVTVDPVSPLPANANIYVKVDAGAIRDTATTKATGVLYREDFETLHMLDSPRATDGVFNPAADANDYALFMTGMLDVKEAGEYTFLSSSDDGAYLLIDLNGDGALDAFEGSDDVVIWDNTTHGVQNILSPAPVTLAVGQYKFEYMYFERGGGSSGEAAYAKGNLTEFDANKFAVIGDDSKGIGVTAEQIKATTYKALADTVNNIDVAIGLRDGTFDLAEGFPASAVYPFADVWNTGGQGNFNHNFKVPGVPETDPGEGTDYAAAGPIGYVLANNQKSTQPAYDGWTFLDKNFWINEQGNQDRTTFTKGVNVVAVMDPDAVFDFDIEAGGRPVAPYEAFMTLPAISLADVAAGSVKLNFDSSFRPEGGQTGLIDISFDGGANWDNVLLYDTDTLGLGNNTLEFANESISLDIANPAGGSMLVRFGMVNASNNWWWAVDNIEISGNAVGDLFDGIADRTTWNFDTFLGNPADFNNDGKVDLTDFGLLKDNFGKSPATKAEGDANGDGKIDLTDFGILKDNFGWTAPVAAAATVAQATDYAFAVAVSQAAKSSTGDGDDDPFADDSI